MHIAHGILMLLMHQTWPKLSRLVSKFLRLPQLPEGNWSTAIRSYARASGCGQVVLLSSSHFEGLASTNDSSSITILPNLRLQRKPSTHLQSMQISVTLVTFLQTSCQLPSKALLSPGPQTCCKNRSDERRSSAKRGSLYVQLERPHNK